MGAPLMVELEGETDPLKIAMKELKYVIMLVWNISSLISFSLIYYGLQLVLLVVLLQLILLSCSFWC